MGAAVEERDAGTAAGFGSAAELREVLDRLLKEADADPEVGPQLRSTHVPHRFVFPDLGVVLNVTGSDEPGHSIRWSFSDDVDWKPAITLEMDSEVANRYLQGHENLAIAMTRRKIRVSCTEARAALSFLPTARCLVPGYQKLVERSYPHLAAG
jgi:hypothetical protein